MLGFSSLEAVISDESAPSSVIWCIHNEYPSWQSLGFGTFKCMQIYLVSLLQMGVYDDFLLLWFLNQYQCSWQLLALEGVWFTTHYATVLQRL